jgi:hypothetical protein
MVYRTNNPLEFDEVDGIVVDERAPAPQIQGVGANVVIMACQLQRGPVKELTIINSLTQFQELFGKSNTYLGNIQLKNKKFPSGKLKIIRVEPTGAALATKTFDDGGGTPVDIIKFDAKYKGAYGNSIKVTIEDGSLSGKKYTISDTSSDAVLEDEEYDNIEVADIDSTTFADSKLVDVTVLATSAEPDDATATALASGSDGTLADTDYEDAIAVAAQEGSGNVLFLDQYNETRNAYLKTHAGLTQDKMVICSHEESTSVTTAISNVATLRDTAGRIIYAFNWVQTLVNGVKTYTSPASWYASILSQTHPKIDPAYAGNSEFLFGVTGLKLALTRGEFISLKDAGISAFENDKDIGFKVKSGIVTQIADSSKLTVLRRRMTDYLTDSIATFLKVYQNAVNSLENRNAVNGAIRNFVRTEEAEGNLPKDSEVSGGAAKLIDTDSLNTDLEIGLGKFYVLYKQRIYSSMRFIVLQAEIGETVVVTESEV